jgi:acetyl-CoA decarbonylase/synthase complex subunit gamma
MALTGLDIYKKLPKENCKECGLPTCLAFAMKVAAGQAGLDKCPRLSDAARGELGEASAPPQRLVKIGTGDKAVEIGQETVLFRHEEKFHHGTAVALTLSDKGDEAALKEACASFKQLAFTRVGETIHPDMIALMNDSGSAGTFAAAANTVAAAIDVPVVLVGTREAVEAAATGPLAGKKPLLYCRGDVAADALAELAKKTGSPVCVAGSLEQVAEAVEALGKLGVKDVIISAGPCGPAGTLDFLTRSRRAALRKKFRPLGCPALAIAIGQDKALAALDACTYVAKYAGVVVSDAWQPHLLVPVLTTRQNIYTDPQKPVQVEAKLYEIGEVTPQSPILVTTNFSLSYYSVEAEAEASRMGCRILAVDTEGTSVLTAWAADKFNAETITSALKSCKAEEIVSHRKLILPGHVAVLAASVTDESGWEVLVGPKEATGLAPYLKNEWKVA